MQDIETGPNGIKVQNMLCQMSSNRANVLVLCESKLRCNMTSSYNYIQMYISDEITVQS